MEKILFLAVAASLISFAGDAQVDTINGLVRKQYIDLNTGQYIDLWYDSTKNASLNVSNGNEVYFYVDPAVEDTIYGKGRYIVNGYVLKGSDNKYLLNPELLIVEQNEVKVKRDGSKLKVAGDKLKIKDETGKEISKKGYYKLKTDDEKIKIDTSKDKIKAKNSEGKAVSKTGYYKSKDETVKTKIDSTKDKEKVKSNFSKSISKKGVYKEKGEGGKIKIDSTKKKIKIKDENGKVKGKAE